MGGLAVAIDWEHAVAEQHLDAMLSRIPHRAAGGFTRGLAHHAAFGEARDLRDASPDEAVASVGTLSIVADLRLWNRGGLRARAGGSAVPGGMDDRRLLLEAYRRTGIDFLDDVDGDFAFVIWDDAQQEVLAVRDRFAVKPLCFERTDSGIRFASEPKQLAGTGDHRVVPCQRAIADLLVESFGEARFTYFEGIQRVLPSIAICASAAGTSERRYWSPNPDTVPSPPTHDIAGQFRERLVEAVRHRVETSGGVVSQLSGGLDSTAIAAAANILQEGGTELPPFHTVSAIFPGLSCDESTWINDVVETQPFPHHESIPQIPDIAVFDQDMWETDAPWVQPIRGMWTFPAEIGRSQGADMALTGLGGDEVVAQSLLLPDLLRTGSFARWIRAGHAYATWSKRRIDRVLLPSILTALPRWLKDAVRALTPESGRPRESLISSELWRFRTSLTAEPRRIDYGFPSVMQNLAVADSQDGLGVWSNDAIEANFAYRGLGVSHPFLDRSVTEFVASIPVLDRPFDGRTKELIRVGFSGELPASVLDRPQATVFEEYLDAAFGQQALAYRDRYPRVSEAAEAYLDRDRYRAAIARIDDGPVGRDHRYALWSAWTLMAWLDGLTKYETRAHEPGAP